MFEIIVFSTESFKKVKTIALRKAKLFVMVEVGCSSFKKTIDATTELENNIRIELNVT